MTPSIIDWRGLRHKYSINRIFFRVFKPFMIQIRNLARLEWERMLSEKTTSTNDFSLAVKNMLACQVLVYMYLGNANINCACPMNIQVHVNYIWLSNMNDLTSTTNQIHHFVSNQLIINFQKRDEIFTQLLILNKGPFMGLGIWHSLYHLLSHILFVENLLFLAGLNCLLSSVL